VVRAGNAHGWTLPKEGAGRRGKGRGTEVEVRQASGDGGPAGRPPQLRLQGLQHAMQGMQVHGRRQ
jgi:hypothetical protein